MTGFTYSRERRVPSVRGGLEARPRTEQWGSTFTLALLCKLPPGSGGWGGCELFGVSAQLTPLVLLYTLSQGNKGGGLGRPCRDVLRSAAAWFRVGLLRGKEFPVGFGQQLFRACSLAPLAGIDAICCFILFSGQKPLFCKLIKTEASIFFP